MNTANLDVIARDVLNEDGQSEIEELLREGKTERAKEFLLSAVDSYRERGVISFVKAAEFYNLLDLPLERVLKFPQKGC